MTQPAPAAGEALPLVVDALASRVIAIYTAAEQELITAVGQIARRGMRDSTALAQIAMLAQMRQAATRLATQLRLRTGPLVAQVVTEAARHGQDAAVRMLQRIVAGRPELAAVYLGQPTNLSALGVASANMIAVDLAGRLDHANVGIVRYADDAYRAAVAEASTRLVLARESLTPATAQSAAWSELNRLGITGLTDARGARWNLSSYVKVATRTATQRAYNTAHEARMTSVGVRYFTVASNGHPCPLCRPWEGAIMSNGPTGSVTDSNPATGASATFTVKGTVEQARAEGLFHPNCRHVLVPYLPGVTTLSRASSWTATDQAAYDATQTLRRLERAVRAAKREELGALDDLSRLRAARKVRALQARIRAHVVDNDLVRRTRREQLDLGNR